MKIFFLLLFTIVVNLIASVDINKASANELLELNGIGKAKAAKIIEYREMHQCFQNIDELAGIEGIGKKIVAVNRPIIILGACKKISADNTSTISSFMDVLLDPINIIFIIIIFILGTIDQITKKDLKSQIVSVGVLGTFVGVFIGLQSFDPQDIINSVNDILAGLKTAFLTSIVGMSVATILSIIEILKGDSEKK